MAIQQNNGGPVGYGQPQKGNGMRRRLLREEDEQMFGPPGQTPESQDAQQLGQGQPPSVYPQQPPGIPSGWQRPAVMPRDPGQSWSQPDRPDMPGQGGQYGNYGMPGRMPMTGAGENQYSQQSYQTRTDDPFIAGIRNQMSTPMGQGGQTPGVPGGWQQNQQQRNTGVSGGADFGQPQAQGQYGALQSAAQQSMQGFTDIAGMRDVFKPGQFMGQLEGFNTNSWGTGERGSDTLKNMFGTIASNYDVSQPGALQRALPDIQKALPGATIVSHANEDLLDPDGPNGPMQPVDVIRSAVAGGSGAAWQWGPLDQKGAPNAGISGPQGPSNQMYNSAITQMTPQAGGVGPDGAPQVQDQNSAMAFLDWLMKQNQGDNLMSPPQV